MTRHASIVLVMSLALGLQGCCDEVPAAMPGPQPALQIVAWGPQQTVAGMAFNRLPGGQSALWIRLNRPVDGHAVLVGFGDAYLEGDVSGDTVTAVVPDASYANEGVQVVSVVARRGRAVSRSNEVAFIVDRPAATARPRPHGP